VERPQFKRRWFQFSLRALLAVTTLLAIWLGWTARYLKTLEGQWDALDRMQAESHGTEDVIGFKLEPATVLGSSLPSRLNPKWQIVRRLDLKLSEGRRAPAREIGNFPHLTSLALHAPSITDIDLNLLGQLRELRELSISSEYVTGEFLAAGRLHQTLEALELKHNALNDSGCQEIGKCARLRTLTLQKFTGYGYRYDVTDWSFLRQLPQLRELSLVDSVSAVTLRELSLTPSLRKLDIDSGLSNADVAEIARSQTIEELHITCLPMQDSTVDLLKSMKQLKRCVICAPLSQDIINELAKSRPGWEIDVPTCILVDP